MGFKEIYYNTEALALTGLGFRKLTNWTTKGNRDLVKFKPMLIWP